MKVTKKIVKSWFSQKDERAEIVTMVVWSCFSEIRTREKTLYSEKVNQKKINVKWKNEGQFWMFSGFFDKYNQNTNLG